MPTRAQFRMTLAVVVGTMAAMSLVRLAAMRRAGDDGPLGTIADAVNIAI